MAACSNRGIVVDAERWKRFKEVCSNALDLAPGHREAYLTAACAGQPELLSEVRLAVAASNTSGLLDRPDSFFASLLPPADGLPAPGFAADMIVARRFRVIRHIARGGMGEVYEAFDSQLGERVALKTIRPEIASDVRVLEQFKKEVRRTRMVSSPHVCRVHDLFVYRAADGTETTFFSMKLLEGETLAVRLKRSGLFSPADALLIARGIVNGLIAAHAAWIVHGDLKPSNVMLTPEGAVITDFGLARRILRDESETVSVWDGVSGGTPAYMSPEQVDGKPATAATDIYALGLILFEMVTGRQPFSGGNVAELAMARLRKDPPKPTSLVPGLSPVLERTVLRCLQRDPVNRFQSAAEIVSALDTIQPAVPPAKAGRGKVDWRKLNWRK